METKKLNLLPDHKQQELYYNGLVHGVLVAVSIVVFILLLGILAQVTTRIYLNKTIAQTEADILTLQQTIDQTENADTKKEIRDINNKITDFDNLLNLTPQWSRAISALVDQIPNGVLISQINANLENKEISIAGFAPTRDLVIELYNNINFDKDHFHDINYPLENVAKPTNVQFTFTFFVNDEILIPKQ